MPYVFEDVQLSDSEFLDALNDIEPKSCLESVAKCIGQTGIGIKKRIEGILYDIVYPKFHHKISEDIDNVDGLNLNMS